MSYDIVDADTIVVYEESATIELSKPSARRELLERVVKTRKQVSAMKVTDTESRRLAIAAGQDIVTMEKFISGLLDSGIKKAHDLHKDLCTEKKDFTSILADAKEHLRVSIDDYDAEQEVIRKEQERLAEVQRLEAEAKIRAEQARLEEEARAAAETKRLAEVEVAIQEGRTEEADELMAAPLEIPLTVVTEIDFMPSPPAQVVEKVEGHVKTTTWKCEVVNMKLLCEAIGKGLVPVSYVEANQSALNGRARADKSAFSVPGCVAVTEKKSSFRAR